MIPRPNVDQLERDRLDDHDVVSVDDRTGQPPHALDDVEVLAG